MKGLYLNVAGATEGIQRIGALVGAPTRLATGAHPAFRDVVVDYHADAWPEGPIVNDRDGRLFAAASGWMSFRGEIGALAAFARAFAAAHGHAHAHGPGAAIGTPATDSMATIESVLAEVDAGAFVILLAAGDDAFIITDPFGLHPHYFADDPFARIAPSPHFLKEGRAIVPEHATILRAKNHLFGNLTIYEGIERLEPGVAIARAPSTRDSRYFRYESARSDVRELAPTMRRALAFLAGRRTIVPLSGGLDSRLLAHSGDFDYGYTFGPAATGDRPIARRFASRFREYAEFSLLDLTYPSAHREAGAIIFDGVCEKPFLEILSVYRSLHERWGGGCFFLDGYLGDVLQRGTYLTYGGVLGSMAKLLPWITLRNLDGIELLRRRHAAIPPGAFRIVADLYERTVGEMDLDEAHRVLLFEILYGRGARYSINGGTVLSGQYWTPVQAFFLPQVFRLLFGQRMEDALFYRTVRAAWSAVPREVTDVPTYSGFRPHWNAHRSRATMLVVKGLAKAGLYKRAVSYESELPRIRWS
jgi:hypothetical protein